MRAITALRKESTPQLTDIEVIDLQLGGNNKIKGVLFRRCYCATASKSPGLPRLLFNCYGSMAKPGRSSERPASRLRCVSA